MSELQVIQAALEKAAKRRRFAQALRGVWYGLLIGGIITLVITGIYHVRDVPFRWVIVAGFAPLPLMLLRAIIVGWRKQAEHQAIHDVGKQVAGLAVRDLQQHPAVLEPTQKALEKTAELGDQLQKQSLTRSEALKDLANTAEKLKEQLNDLGKDPDLK